ncbi:zinc-dependent metalloprotease family protein [Chelatococcus sp. GCM10030263]|uniref:zinc-dependent metalloprotease family protein n=1 Tax=Chelatococcus sp. GCM10030263 TaxID=3273387 RepID=UPI00361FAA8B
MSSISGSSNTDLSQSLSVRADKGPEFTLPPALPPSADPGDHPEFKLPPPSNEPSAQLELTPPPAGSHVDPIASAVTSLTPNDIDGGQLPSGYRSITFTLSNGNWRKYLTLPKNPNDGDQVTIASSATLLATLTGENLEASSINIASGNKYTFQYDFKENLWRFMPPSSDMMSPSTVSENIPDVAKGSALSIYTMYNGSWAPSIKLPAHADDSAVILVHSEATYNSKINGDNLLYAGTTDITAGDAYAFKYMARFGKWVLDRGPTTELNATDATAAMPRPTTPITVVDFSDESFLPQIKLPETAGDRDRVILRSTAATTAEIDSSNINNPGPTKLHNGDTYEFLYIAEKQKWEMVRSPDTTYRAGDLTDGKLPPLDRPKILVHVSDGNWQANIELPPGQPSGSRVVFDTVAAWSFSVTAGSQRYQIDQGETVAFIVNEKGEWERETITIDLLLLYSHKAAEDVGEQTVKDYLRDSFQLTNEALENSGANFRFRQVGTEKIHSDDKWKTLEDALLALRSQAEAQALKSELKADVTFYVGTETGGGLAYVGGPETNMVGTGNIYNPTSVMRHELGHVMGLAHGGEGGSYAQGYPNLPDVMSGNAIPYYANPNRYTPDYGIPMGIEGRYDSVRAMNERAAQVAAYR